MPLNPPAIGSASRTPSSWCSVAHVAHRRSGPQPRKQPHRGPLHGSTVRPASMLANTLQGHSSALVLPKSGASVYISVYIKLGSIMKNTMKSTG